MKKELEEPVEEPEEEPIEEPAGEPEGEPIGEPAEESQKKSIEGSTSGLKGKAIKNYKEIVRGIIISLCALLGIYLGMTIYFINHFCFGSEINGINVSGKNLDDVKSLMATELQAYTLNLKERGGKFERIKAGEAALKYNSEEDIKKFKDGQNPFKWISACFDTKDSKLKVGFSFDEKLLKERIDKLSCFDSKNIIEPENPGFQYVNNNYVIIDEVAGNKVDKDILYSNVADALHKGETEIDLESVGCYIKPQYNSKSPEIIQAKDTLNKYVASKITYTFGDSQESIDCSVINKWLTIDKNFKVIVDAKKVKDYVNKLSKTYNTIGKTRNFVTSSGKTVKVGGGDYGWSINKTKEAQNIISAIKEGKTITKEPAYRQTAFSKGSNDIGKTYVEIDLTNQHIWFYKNGSLIVQGNVVTGNVKASHATPKGIYTLKYKQRNAILKGPDYASPVTFWMPFNGGIGIHDASWRSVFGGNIYRRNGSHGCVNSPYYVAKAIFNNIVPGTPVVCY